MIKMRRLNKILIAVFMIALLALCVTLPVLDNNFRGLFVNSEDINVATADAPNGPGTTYGQLASGSTYQFTDLMKVMGVSNPTDDITTVTIDTTKTHGSYPENPYVIDNITRWNKLATDGASDNSTTSGKHYILTADLNFNGQTFNRVNFFKGNFYGLGHTISNISLSGTATTSTNYQNYMGIFGRAQSATITDIVLTGFTATINSGTGDRYIGGIVGAVEQMGAVNVLNCHAEVSFSKTVAGIVRGAGSILGLARGNTAGEGVNIVTTFIYRCSGKINATNVASPTADVDQVRIGGIQGQIGHSNNGTIRHCYGEVFIGSITKQNQVGIGSICGYLVRPYAPVIIEHCAGTVKSSCDLGPASVSGTSSNIASMIASLVPLASNGKAEEFPNTTVNNTYSYLSSQYGGKNSNLYSIATTKNYESLSVPKNFTDVWTAYDNSKSDFNKESSWNPSLATYKTTGYNTPEDIRDTICNQADLWTKANANLLTDIWDGTLSTTYSYTVATSPVRNTLKTSGFKLNIKDLKNDGTAENISGAPNATYNYGSTPSLSIISNTKGRSFTGYTFSKTSTSNKFTTLPSGTYYGDIDVYAVWDVNDNDVTKNINVQAINGSYEMDGSTYVIGIGTTLQLSAHINLSSMDPDCSINCEWRKSGGSTTTGQVLNVTSASQTGTYDLYYKISSTKYKYWESSNWRLVGTTSVRVEGQPATLASINVTKAYVGMPMKDIQYTATYTGNNNTPLTGGSAVWGAGPDAKINDADGAVYTKEDGKYYYKTNLIYTPANSDYKKTTFEVEFEVKYPTITFNMEGITTPIQIDVVYGNTYNATTVANEFEKAFLANLAAGTDSAYNQVQQLVPHFVINGNEMTINDYRTNGSPITSSGDNVINVKFRSVDYTVTFEYLDENVQTQTHTETHKYGDQLDTTWLTTQPGWVVENNEWKFTDSHGNNRAWRFSAEGTDPADVVTGNIKLTAKLVELNLVLQDLKVTPRNSYVAQTAITSANLTVEAIYYIDNDPAKEYKITLSLGNGQGTTFSAQVVGSIDGKLHVANNTIVVSHTYAGVPKSTDPITLNVIPIEVDTTDCGFEDVTIKYGENISATLPKVRKTLTGVVRPVQYKYYDSNFTEIAESDIVGDVNMDVIYIVRTDFVTINSDYTVTNLSATYTIKSAATEVYLKWDINDSKTFSYNGQVQYPTAEVFRVEDNSKVDITLEYRGDTDKILPGTNYSVTAIIDPEYSIRSGDETCTFSIVKAVLPVPTFEAGSMTFNGEEQTVILTNYDDSFMSLSGMSSATNAGDYGVTVTLSDSNYVFEDGSNSVDIDWSIDKAMLTVVWDKYKFEFDGSVQHPQITRVDGFVADDSFVSTDFIFDGDDDKSAIGSYSITAVIRTGASWADNYQLRNPKRTFAILPEGLGNVSLITVEWDHTHLVFNNEVQMPTPIIKDMDGNILTDIELTFGGDFESSKWAGEYNGNVTADSAYYIVDGKTCEYTISVNADGEGEDPNKQGEDPDPEKPSDGGNAFIDFFKKLIENKFPLWQIATSAVALLLSLIFMIKAIQYSNKAKQAKGEAKKISAKAYSALLPVFSTEVVLAGLSNMIWSIIAFAMVGVTVLMFILALIARKSWKKAELAKENAMENREQRKVQAEREEREAERKERREFQDRMVMAGGNGGVDSSAIIEQMRLEMEARDARYREELARRDEEQAKRDETMKIMLANLMGRQAGDNGFAYASMEDTDMLVQRVIAGLLPAVQEMMPEATAYLTAPSTENDDLRALVEEQNEEMRAMNAKMEELQEQLAAMAQADGNIIIGGDDEKMAQMTETMQQQLAKIEELQAQLSAMEQERVDGVLIPDGSDEKMAEMAEAMQQQLAKIEELQAQLAASTQNGDENVIISDNSEEIKSLTETIQQQLTKIGELQAQLAERPQTITETVYIERDPEDEEDDEEEWDSILDEDEEDNFVEAVIIEADGSVTKVSPNFRMRLKQSSDKNREWYAVIKNMFCSQKGVTYRVGKRVEKIRYQGQVIGVIGVAKRSIKLWLALKPYEYDARRYHQKDVSDKPHFVDVPMYVRVGSDRALERAQELILALFQEFNMEARKRYNDRDIQELIFTLKHNRLLTNKDNKALLRETMHVHDCDVLDDELAQKCIETKNVEAIDDSVIETVKLDDIDERFLDGNRVTLEKLKKAGLVSAECTGVHITADKRLTKPLIIVANDFSLTAVKLITLTGGRAIRLTQVNS